MVQRPRRRAIKGEILVDEATRRRIGRARMRRTLAGVAVIAIAAGVVGVYFSPLLRVQSVEVTGTATVNPDEVKGLLDADGRSMLTADFAAAESRIEDLPQVQSATIERRWPDTVLVTVVERAPWGAWAVGEATYVIDSEGTVLNAAAAPEGTPVVRAIDGAPGLAPGDQVDSEVITYSRELMEQVPARIQLGVTGLEWSRVAGMAVTTDAGYRVVLGDDDNIDYKLAVWQQVEATVGREAMSGHVLDLRFGDRPSLQ
jgi:cell division protein FtsQ